MWRQHADTNFSNPSSCTNLQTICLNLISQTKKNVILSVFQEILAPTTRFGDEEF